LSILLLRRKNQIPNVIAAISAMPPITPPTMAPTGVEDFELVGLEVLGCEVGELLLDVIVTVVVGVMGDCVDNVEVGVMVGDAPSVISLIVAVPSDPSAADRTIVSM
jgi:hypothetical protein